METLTVILMVVFLLLCGALLAKIVYEQGYKKGYTEAMEFMDNYLKKMIVKSQPQQESKLINHQDTLKH